MVFEIFFAHSLGAYLKHARINGFIKYEIGEKRRKGNSSNILVFTSRKSIHHKPKTTSSQILPNMVSAQPHGRPVEAFIAWASYVWFPRDGHLGR